MNTLLASQSNAKTDPSITSEFREHDLANADAHLTQREAYLQRMLVSMSLLARSQGLSSGELKETFQLLTKMTVRTLYVDRVMMGHFDGSRSSLRSLCTYSEATESHSFGESLSAQQAPERFDELQRGWSLEAEDATQDSRFSLLREANPWLRPTGAMLMVPIKHGKRCWGVLACQQWNGARRWGQEERQFVNFVSSLITLGLEVRERLG